MIEKQNHKQKGFTLIEILLSLGILALGLSGILTLFPVGLDAGQKAIQDITSTLIAESLMDVLRASILQKHPDGTLPFIFEDFNKCVSIPNAEYTPPNNTYPKGKYTFKNGGTIEGSCGTGLTAYNHKTDGDSLTQYGYKVYIVSSGQSHLYDVTIVINRNGNDIRNFYSQIMIPTN